MQIAQSRARCRELKNIIWIHSWIEAVKYLGVGLFNELQCVGVLHHLKNPSFGLNILKGVLVELGGMDIMVYAKYGRHSLYQIQHLMKLINSNRPGIDMEIENTNSIINLLPIHNWFVLNPAGTDYERSNSDLYDMFLHKRDIAFSIPTLFQWLQNEGIQFVDFDTAKERIGLNVKYHIQDNDLMRKISVLDKIAQRSTVELFKGNIVKHGFYASKAGKSVARLDENLNVLYIYGHPYRFRETLDDKTNVKTWGNETSFFGRISHGNMATRAVSPKIVPNVENSAEEGSQIFSFKWNNFNRFLVNRLLDSNRGVRVKSIYNEYIKTTGSNISVNELMVLTFDFYNSIKDTGMVLLKRYYVPPLPKTSFVTYFQIRPM